MCREGRGRACAPCRTAPYLLDWAECLAEQVHVELLETGACERLGQVNAVVQGLDLNADLQKHKTSQP